MSIQIIRERFESYQCRTEQDIQNALKEIAQEIALGALARADFFKKAAFQGGTCLRILYGLNRFSEDLDFIMLEPSPQFNWDLMMRRMDEEFRAFGLEVTFQDRSKADNAVKKFFLKDDSLGKLLEVKFGQADQKIKIKFEVDTNPPKGSEYDIRYLDFPFPFAVTTQNLPSLFGGKCHALLCREYVKGRDWYDFNWYVSQKVKPHLQFLENTLIQNGPWEGTQIHVDSSWYLKAMEEKIRSVDWKDAKNDILRFIKPQEIESIHLWSQEFFLDRLKKLGSYFEG